MQIDGDAVWANTYSWLNGPDRMVRLSLSDDNLTFYLSDTEMRRAYWAKSGRGANSVASFEDTERMTSLFAGGQEPIEHLWTLPLGGGFDQ